MATNARISLASKKNLAYYQNKNQYKLATKNANWAGNIENLKTFAVGNVYQLPVWLMVLSNKLVKIGHHLMDVLFTLASNLVNNFPWPHNKNLVH